VKQYPSIPRGIGQDFREFDAHVFDKLDGSNLRFEWSRKRGWHRQGTRHRLFDLSDPQFGPALPMFRETWSEQLSRKFTDDRLQEAIVFLEYWDSSCLGGRSADPEAVKRLTLIDVNVHRRGFVAPMEFVREYAPLGDTAAYLGQTRWTRGFVERVYEGDVEGITLEGVVGKGGEGHSRIMSKAKTRIWLEAIKARYADEAESIINS
jgi:hypothetical protein